MRVRSRKYSKKLGRLANHLRVSKNRKKIVRKIYIKNHHIKISKEQGHVRLYNEKEQDRQTKEDEKKKKMVNREDQLVTTNENVMFIVDEEHNLSGVK